MLNLLSLIFFIEFKSPSGKLSSIQNYIIKILRSHKFDVYVIDNIKEGYEVLQKYECT